MQSEEPAYCCIGLSQRQLKVLRKSLLMERDRGKMLQVSTVMLPQIAQLCYQPCLLHPQRV